MRPQVTWLQPTLTLRVGAGFRDYPSLREAMETAAKIQLSASTQVIIELSDVRDVGRTTWKTSGG